MSKFILVYGSLFFMHILPSICFHDCIHNDISEKDVPVGEMTFKEMRPRRDRHKELFQPLNIHWYIDDFDPSVPENVVFNIKMALEKITDFFRKTIEVRRSFNPFLLERLNCAQKWQNGVNKNKCSRIKSVPEFCSTKLTDYVIPDRYLNKLEVYDFADIKPRRELRAGEGVKDATFILFVISRTTSWCEKEGIQAYGSSCRLDISNRPVAGLLNICPANFANQIYKAGHYYNVIMHEVIHTLGFSRHLYSKFKTCTSIYQCETPKKIVKEDSNKIQRLVFPELVQSMQNHFNCSKDDFGGPLEQFQGNKSDSNTYTSHWHPLLMYTSIMTPAISEGDYLVVDNITLALLSSTGWYRVDFSLNVKFNFGKGQGCNFGFEKNCEDSKNLCNPSKNVTNCDLMHHTINKCESVVPYHPCGVFKPNKKVSCLDEVGKIYRLDMSSMQYVKRCVVVTENKETEPLCAIIQCKANRSIEIYINTTWVLCKEEQDKVEIGNVTTVHCIKDRSFCEGKRTEFDIPFCTADSHRALSIRMYFTDPTFEDLLDDNSFKNFKVSTIRAIAKHVNIPVNYIVNASLIVFKTLYLDFSICPPLTMSDPEFGELVATTQNFLKRSSFTHIFQGTEELTVASTEISLNPEEAISFSDHDGFHMLYYTLPAVCVFFVVATFIASIIRFINIQKHRPKRETVEMADNLGQNNFSSQSSNQTLT